MNTTQQSCLPVEVLTALYRRALAQAYLDACATYGVETGYTLDELQMTIAAVESYYVRQHGTKLGMDIACAMLRDMVQPDILVAKPRLTPLGESMMDELFRPCLHTTPHTTLH